MSGRSRLGHCRWRRAPFQGGRRIGYAASQCCCQDLSLYHEIRLHHRGGEIVGRECLAEWTALSRGARTPDFPTARERARAKRRSKQAGSPAKGGKQQTKTPLAGHCRPTVWERARAKRRSNPVGKSGEGSASCIRSTTRRTFPTYSLGACKGQETLEAGGKPRHQAQNSKFVFGQRNGSTTRLERLATSSSRR